MVYIWIVGSWCRSEDDEAALSKYQDDDDDETGQYLLWHTPPKVLPCRFVLQAVEHLSVQSCLKHQHGAVAFGREEANADPSASKANSLFGIMRFGCCHLHLGFAAIRVCPAILPCLALAGRRSWRGSRRSRSFGCRSQLDIVLRGEAEATVRSAVA
jgi:hypothetical protein